MSERRKVRAQSIIKGLGVPSTNDSGMGAKKKSLSRISSSVSQSDTGRGKGRRKKDAHMEEADEAAMAEQLRKAEWEQMLAKLKASAGLEKLREEMVRQDATQEKKEKVVSFTVKKKNPNYRRRMTVAVAVPAPSDVEAVPLTLPAHKGPRMDESGRVVPHSILGSVVEYSVEAQRQGAMHVVTSQKDGWMERNGQTDERKWRNGWRFWKRRKDGREEGMDGKMDKEDEMDGMEEEGWKDRKEGWRDRKE
ncbi:uncharacterized protein LOC124274743 [Haliotis rubra]|uniref:uncharacterized protein LOC124274743 n=1 Tax=Haliotis rubra TaxID=36100 RepID=UPI001EE4F0FE|nr:uncharacterized protein LOC124274743 [Haliotis rubra]